MGPGPGSGPSPAARPLVVGLPGVAREDLPTIDLGALSLGIARLGFRDRTAPDVVPLAASATLALRGPTRLLGPEPEALPPLALDLTAAAPPFVGAARIGLTLAPFQATPGLSAELDVRGVSGPGLLQVLPDLAERFDLTGLVDGRLAGRLTASFDAQRRGPAAFDLSRGLGLSLDLEGLAARASGDGEVLLGVERVHVEAPRLSPAEGQFLVRSVEVSNPRLRARRTAQGLEVLGVVVRPAPAATDPATDPAMGAAPAVDPAQSAAAAAAPAGGTNAVFGVESLTIDGLDLLVEDRSVTPAMSVPLTDLDVEVRGFTTRPGSTTTFRANVAAGRIELPERTGGDSLVTGLLGAAAGAVTGGNNRFRREERPLFEGLDVSGKLTLGQGPPSGSVTVDLATFELQGVRGLAKAAGVDIADGLVDSRVTLRLLGERGLRLDTRTVFSHLFVSEPPGGPISKYLALPAPLDTVLYVLRDENEQQVIPLSVTLPAEGAATGKIVAAVSTTLGTLIGEAIASSPLRIGQGALGALGVMDLLGGNEPPPLGAPYTASFGALDIVLDARSREVLHGIAADVRRVPERKVRLVHELGGGDLAAAAAATALTPESVQRLAEALLSNQRSLAAERDALEAGLRGQLSVGRTGAAEAERLELVAVLERLAETEAALDQVLGLLRPGADRDAARRVRATSVVLGQARLDAVRATLIEAGLPATRIEVRRPRASTPTGSAGGRVLVEQR